MHSLGLGGSDRSDLRHGSDFAGVLALLALLGALIAVLLGRNPLLFWNDDYELSILPVFADVARSWSEGHLPLLSPYSWVCSNLAGEFQYGTFSIFVNAAVVLIWKLPLTFPQQAAALSIVHLVPLALGGYFLARERKVAPPLAAMVGLVAATNGWVICWGATDWFGALGALTWLPWTWWGMERAGDPARSRWRFLWPAPFVYLLVTGGFPYTVLMLGLLVAWLSLRSVVQQRRLIALLPIALGLSLGLGLSAPAWLALFDYLRGSAREVQESAAHFQWVVPIASLPGFVLPSWTVLWADFSTRLMPHSATEMTCGLVAPVVMIAALLRRGRELVRQSVWEVTLLLVLIIISMLPTTSVFRWSFRWLPFIHLVLAICAADAFPFLNSENGGMSWKKFSTRPSFAAFVIVFVLAVAARIFGADGQHGSQLAITLLLIAFVWFVIDLIPMTALHAWSPAGITFAALVGTYLVLPTNVGVPKYRLEQQLTRPAPLDPKRLYLSIYPAPEEAYRMGRKEGAIGQTIRLGSTSMWAALRFVNGYSPIRPAGVAREFDFAIHGEVPDWMSNYLLGWQAGPDGELARLGVDGVIVADELDAKPEPAEEWVLETWTDEGRIFHRRGAPFPTVRSVRWPEPELVNSGVRSRMDVHERTPAAAGFATAAIRNIDDSRNAVAADVAVADGGRPALIAFSRPFFRGYHASLGGQPLDVSSYRGLFPTVELRAGTAGRLSLVYRPWWLTSGCAIASIAAAAWLSGVLAAALSRRRS